MRITEEMILKGHMDIPTLFTYGENAFSHKDLQVYTSNYISQLVLISDQQMYIVLLLELKQCELP